MPVPPDPVTVAVPSEPPLQLTLLLPLMEVVNVFGSVTVIVVVVVQLFASVTV